MACRSFFAFLYFVCFAPCFVHAGEAAHAAAEVTLLIGEVRLERAGKTIPLKLGDKVWEKDVLQTPPGGHLHLRTVDLGFMSLRSDSRAVIETYRYDPQNPDKTKIRLLLEKGVMRTVSGNGAQAARQNFRLNTPIAAIGIKGTDFTVLVAEGLTRTAVNRGVIVLAGFDAACLRDTLGPCSGESALVQSAQQVGQLLELRQGQSRPAVISVLGNNHPDMVSPPSETEPSSKRDEKSGALTGQAVKLTNEKLMLDSVEKNAMGSADSAPDAVFSRLNWGRWGDLVATGDGAGFSQWLRENGDLVGLNSVYMMARADSDKLILPKTGQFEFKLVSADAVIRDRSATSVRPALVLDGSLAVDFSRQSFNTRLKVEADNALHQLSAVGVVSDRGGLNGNYPLLDRVTNTFVRGALAGENAKQAGYVFEYAIREGAQRIVGVTQWQR